MSEKNNTGSRREFLKRAGGLLLASCMGVPRVLHASPAILQAIREVGFAG